MNHMIKDKNCPFCCIENKFNEIYFSDKEKSFPGEAWIDYKKKSNGNILWYAILNGETVHVLCLCESQKHLHFHLIPRHKYSDNEKQFIIDNYGEREKNKYNKFKEKVDKDEFHGMWYAAFHEMNFKKSKYFEPDINKRIKKLEELAKDLRPKYLKNPFV